MDVYDGTYVPATGVVTAERTDTYVYDHKNEFNNLDGDPASGTYNGWIMREHLVYAADGTTVTEQYVYDATGALTSQNVNGDLTEYDAATGRITLIYDASETEYKTYTWGATQATIDVYDGTYVPATGVVTAERTDTYVYDHKNEFNNLDADPASGTYNGWVMREHYVYAADGTTVTEEYIYNAAGSLVSQNINGDISEFDPATGRHTLYYDSTNTEYKTYAWGATQVTMDVYDGTYVPATGVVTTERTDRFVYDHKDEFANLDADPASGTYNGWVMREHYVYAADGTTVNEMYIYDATGALTSQTIAGDITEYDIATGLVALYYDSANTEYKTYTWDSPDTGKVTVDVYDGTYVPATGVVASERDATYVYYYNAEQANLDPSANGWTLKEKTEYLANGVTVDVVYTYYLDANNRMETKTLTAVDGFGNIYYSYINESFDHDASGGIDADENYGRTLIAKRTSLNPSGEMSFLYQYHTGSNQAQYTYSYSDANMQTAHSIYTYDISGNMIQVVKPEDFKTGANLPWINYGWDIGTKSNSGSGFHDGLSDPENNYENRVALEAALDEWQGDYIRVFLFNDFRAGVDFDGTGIPLNLTDNVFEDMQVLLDAAEARGIKVMPVLFDFLLADNVVGGSDQEHPDLISEAAKRTALVDLFRPFIQQFGDHDAIYAWDVMNEPEFTSVGLGGSVANFADTQAFVQAFVNMIHAETTSAQVTVGSRNRLDMLTYWTGMGLDIYQFHYYDAMGGSIPLDYAFTAGELALLG